MSEADTNMRPSISSRALGRAASTLVFVSVLGSPSFVRADDFHATRSEKLVEKTHKIDIRLGHGYADLVVRRTAHNGGPRHDQAIYYIDMPSGAVATGLRTLGMMAGKPHWFEGELMEAEAAAAKYAELTGIGGYYPKDPALLSWRSQDRLALQVFPCSPGEDKTVEYTLRIPADYRDGRYHIDLPAMGTDKLFADANITPMVSGETVFLNDKPVPAPAWVALKEAVDLSVAPSKAETVSGALAAVPVATTKNLAHFHIEAAPKLSRVPDGAYVAVLLDASRSIDDEIARAEIAMARAYLSHFNGGHVAVIPFDRKARLPKADFVTTNQAIAELGKTTLDLKNGSNIDDALATADALLAKAPSKAAKRILAFTDSRAREELTPERLASQLKKSGALLHIGVLGNQQSTFVERDDGHEWNVATKPSGGLVWSAGISVYDEKEVHRQVFEEWARPKRLHHFKVNAVGMTAAYMSPPNVLDEGQGYEHLQWSEAPVAAVEIDGESWATPVHRVIYPDEAEGKRWAGLVFGTSSLYDLSEEEIMPLAMHGRVVSPVTSYLAIEPGVRPSTEGLEQTGTGEGFGSGHGRLSGAHRTKPVLMQTFDKEGFLKQKLADGLATCGGKGKAVTATIESTLEEIVSVRSSIDGEKAGSKLVVCFEEAAWAIVLPSAFRAEHQSFTITL